MLRPMWSGTISFGLVGIPVKPIPAQSPSDIRFDLLHRKCHTRLLTQRFCPECRREVPEEEIVRGYQYTRGDYVVIEEKEFDELARRSADRK